MVCNRDHLSEPSWPIETERLLLRPFEAGDLEALQSMHWDPGVVHYLYNEAPPLDEVRELLDQEVAGRSVQAEGEWLSAAAVLRESGEVVGDVALQWASEVHRQGEIGYIVHQGTPGPWVRRGKRHGRCSASRSRRSAYMACTGVSSRGTSAPQHVLEKVGMRREAHLIENEWVKGEWQSRSHLRDARLRVGRTRLIGSNILDACRT